MNWQDITIEQYNKIVEFTTKHPNDSMQRTLDYLYGVKTKNMKLTDYLELVRENAWVNRDIPSNTMKEEYILNGHKYQVSANPGDFTTAQYVDLTTLVKDTFKYEDVMSCLLIPEGKIYLDGYDVNEVKKDILTMSICDAMGVMSFFLVWSRKFIDMGVLYLERANKELPKKGTKVLKEQIRTLLDNLASFRSF